MNDPTNDPDVPQTPASPEPVAEPPSKEELRLAMKAFRKRLKLMRLDDESSLGYGPMSSGNSSQIGAIRPPDQFPKEIWRELENKGKIRREGGGLYSIVES
ncbi:hypothetical protein N9N28_10365 [Rubripirellula amarantea]|uniref:hypothetical protein n=1 Tax=Rubripirellula amarantea TaxID=2527999 RepID=UPI0011B70064|nr:hypothetical protein [Rubripirellula amarantea]MDA8745024.1 hypothetical protein [Rubripirellula amarantea]